MRVISVCFNFKSYVIYPSMQVFDLRSLAWSSLKLKPEVNADKAEDSGSQEILPPTSDHRMVRIDKLYTKVQKMPLSPSHAH